MLPRLVLAILALSVALVGQDPQAGKSDEFVLRVTPTELTLPIGEKAQLTAELVDIGGRPVEGKVLYFSRARRSLRINETGEVEALQAGTFQVIARSTIGDERGPQAMVTVTVPHPEPASIALRGAPKQLHVGTTTRLVGEVLDLNQVVRSDLEVSISSSDASVASIDAFGHVTGTAPGQIVLLAKGGGLSQEFTLEVLANPVSAIEIGASATVARTGDVVTFTANTTDASGNAVEGVPVEFTFHAAPDDSLGNAATGQIEQDGRFVAETPGLYTVVATCGTATDRMTIRANKRFEKKMKLEKIGHGEVFDVHTSDLWVWEGVDGRDYAVTGTWGANGDAIFWDVTDPANMERIATVQVDARTVNDVKVSEDGRLCIISREGASNRKNGLVVLDVQNPREPKPVSIFDDELTGGVHNVFIDKGYVYALSAGRRYDVIDINNPATPSRVGSFQLFEPGASIHDVWIEDGIAFSSNWRYGLRLVDVGNGVAGGSPSNPVEFANYAYPNGWNHAAFPWKSPDTDKFYVLAGDEAFPFGLSTEDNPTYARGWIHFVDFTDHKSPREVARYEVPEAGTHNLWVEGNTAYVAYYNGGLRVVDISGDLMGDLYRQGRELAFFLPTHPKGKVSNAPMVWGPQPYKGKIFFSDWNTGLWCVELVEDQGRGR